MDDPFTVPMEAGPYVAFLFISPPAPAVCAEIRLQMKDFFSIFSVCSRMVILDLFLVSYLILS